MIFLSFVAAYLPQAVHQQGVAVAVVAAVFGRLEEASFLYDESRLARGVGVPLGEGSPVAAELGAGVGRPDVWGEAGAQVGGRAHSF